MKTNRTTGLVPQSVQPWCTRLLSKETHFVVKARFVYDSDIHSTWSNVKSRHAVVGQVRGMGALKRIWCAAAAVHDTCAAAAEITPNMSTFTTMTPSTGPAREKKEAAACSLGKTAWRAMTWFAYGEASGSGFWIQRNITRKTTAFAAACASPALFSRQALGCGSGDVADMRQVGAQPDSCLRPFVGCTQPTMHRKTPDKVD
jgi:hypothetical protein